MFVKKSIPAVRKHIRYISASFFYFVCVNESQDTYVCVRSLPAVRKQIRYISVYLYK